MSVIPSVLLQMLVVLALLARDGALALCPSDGNTHVVYVTSNMGDNIWSFDTTGHYIGNVLNKSSFPFRVDKLRDMRFGPGNHLYISSARGQYSRVFAVSGNGLLNNTLGEKCIRNYLFTATTQSSSNPFLDHPYAIAFHPDDDSLYVANQNSATITKYTRTNADKPGYPEWEPIANVKHATSNSTDMPKGPSKAGLFASSWSAEYSMASVRGLAISPPLPRALVEQAAPAGWFATERNYLTRYILVCDVALDQVQVFLADTGEHVFAIPVAAPVQVLFPSRYLKPVDSPASYFEVPHVYVTSREDGMAYLVPFLAPQQKTDVVGITTLTQYRGSPYAITNRVPQHSVSGIFENPSHDMLLIADRSGRKISTYASPFLTNFEAGTGPSPLLGYFTTKLPDEPEFIVTTMVEQQSSIPFCYELSENGTFRYVALCTAAYIWTATLIMFCIVGAIVVLAREVRHCQERRRRQRKERQFMPEVENSEEVPLVSEARVGGYGTGMVN
ncbi:putative mucin-associated surface protein (MASP) [Trypanosoma grayi]|uniref:putative mucin-associated surface protein (MASP) n=1 Tax=Trypanosoma grayi TaxID=71804 RepID=UPI0004F456C5|nr:putative mucin-associated surface protein (MASP) [Trypanosoma grayi]KEG12144.1 putative mucin-associated surface protein (MASP) [Trypanosoma grayi]